MSNAATSSTSYSVLKTNKPSAARSRSKRANRIGGGPASKKIKSKSRRQEAKAINLGCQAQARPRRPPPLPPPEFRGGRSGMGAGDPPRDPPRGRPQPVSRLPKQMPALVLQSARDFVKVIDVNRLELNARRCCRSDSNVVKAIATSAAPQKGSLTSTAVFVNGGRLLTTIG